MKSHNKAKRAMSDEQKLDFAWRKDIRKRDGYKCKKCHNSNIKQLQVHHIKPRSTHPQLVRAKDNGITLCRTCHKQMRGDEAGWDRMCQILIANKDRLAKVLMMMKELKDADDAQAKADSAEV